MNTQRQPAFSARHILGILAGIAATGHIGPLSVPRRNKPSQGSTWRWVAPGPRNPAKARARKIIDRIIAHRRRRDLLKPVHRKAPIQPSQVAFQVRSGGLTADEMALFA
jgi:hypothetical protein